MLSAPPAGEHAVAGTRTRTRGPILVVLAAVILGILIGRATGEREPEVRVVRGVVDQVSGSGEGIGVDNESYLVGTGLDWRGVDGSWREGGQPECLAPLSSGAEVELGILPVPHQHEAGGRPNHVAWVKCVSMPAGGP